MFDGLVNNGRLRPGAFEVATNVEDISLMEIDAGAVQLKSFVCSKIVGVSGDVGGWFECGT